MSEIFLSCIVPVYNEEKNLLMCFNLLFNHLKELNKNFEIIFVNDGSTDRTQELLLELSARYKNVVVLNNERNMGKGYSLKKGVIFAKGNYLITTDADLSVPITLVSELLKALEIDHDIAIGSRKMCESKILEPQPFLRRTLSNIYRLITRFFFKLNVSDVTCGFKGYRKSAAKKIFHLSRINRWGIDAEILFLAKLFNFKIKEIPVTWRNSGSTKVTLLIDIFQSLYELFKVKINYLNGYYDV